MSSFSRAMPDDGTAFIILGADAVLAALPATPVQLAHACQSLGFQLAAPATWGDELIAEGCLDQLTSYEHPSAVICNCPLVTERLTRASTTLEPFMLTFASPPVATARYLRAAFAGQALHITYAGACPGADDDVIDARLRPSDLLDAFVSHGIVLGAQPNCFDALVPLDRRRFFSLPGGVPARGHVEQVARRALVELTGDDAVLELTQLLIEQTPALIDIAMPLGCACAGAGEQMVRGNPRAGLLTLEPPRANQKVLDPSLHVDVSQTLVEACAHAFAATEALVEVEVRYAADAAPTIADDIDVPIADAIEVSAIDTASSALVAGADDIESAMPIVANSADSADVCVAAEVVDVVDVVDVVEVAPAPPRSRRRPIVTRASASPPLSANADGELVPRASLAVLRHALARIAKRKARRQRKVERGRRDRGIEIHEGAARTVARTPRSLAIPPAPDLPRPVPPPPARLRPRSVLGLGLIALLTLAPARVSHARTGARGAPTVTVTSG